MFGVIVGPDSEFSLIVARCDVISRWREFCNGYGCSVAAINEGFDFRCESCGIICVIVNATAPIQLNLADNDETTRGVDDEGTGGVETSAAPVDAEGDAAFGGG